MLPEPIVVTLQVTDALEQVGATYVIGGSLASTIHGVVRTTLGKSTTNAASAGRGRNI